MPVPPEGAPPNRLREAGDRGGEEPPESLKRLGAMPGPPPTKVPERVVEAAALARGEGRALCASIVWSNRVFDPKASSGSAGPPSS